MGLAAVGVVLILGLILLAASVRIVQEYERGVIFRLGRVVAGAKGPGLFFIIPIIDRMVKVNLQIVTLDVPPQDVITKDNVTVRVNAVVYFQVFNPVKAIVEVQNYLFATSQIAQTTLRAVLSKADLDEILSERDRLNSDLQRIIDDLTDPWGIKVALVEIKDVDLPSEMQRAMAKQAEAERERRAKIINAEGEFQASERLAQAAAVIARHPIAYQLRYLQTVTDVSAEKNSTLVIPIPIELLGPFQAAFGKDLSAFSGDGESGDGGPDLTVVDDRPPPPPTH
ncbi:MAG TPA: slipin family protein [Actinomycetota bacterium]|jgi:regulator of protease activity HflC (stomatin/prohibitin superfamily)|nr:slipin family protein [Actinomycetota bacterium]